MKKKQMAFVLSATMLLAGMAGCGKSAETEMTDQTRAEKTTSTNLEPEQEEKDNADKTSDSQEPQHLTFWYGLNGSPGEALQKVIDDYNNSQSEVFVEAQYQGSYEETLNKLKTAVRTQEGPDIVQIYEAGTRAMIDSGFIIPMQQLIEEYDIDTSHLEENILNYYTIDDQLYSMPLNTSIPVCYYNKTILSELGYADGPQSWEDILKISEQVTQQGLASAGFAMTNTIWCFEQPMVQEHYAMVDNDNGRSGRATKTVFGEGELAVDIASMLQEIYEKGYGADVGFTVDANKAAFCAGEAVITCDSSGSLRSLLDTIGGSFDLGVCQFPPLTAESENGGVTLGGASIYVCDNGREGANEAIADFIKYMISPEVQGEFSVSTGYFPITTEAYEQQVVKDNFEQYPQYQVITDALHNSENMGFGPLYASIVECRSIYQKYLEQVMMGEISPEECISKASQEANAIISDYNMANPTE